MTAGVAEQIEDQFSPAFSTAFDAAPTPGPDPDGNGLTLDERVHIAVLKAALAGPLNGHVYDYGEIPGEHGNPGTLPGIFCVITVERRAFGALTRAGRPGTGGWRLITRHVGTTVDEARWAANRTAGALDGVRLVIDGQTTTPVTYEVGDPIRPDEDRFSGSTTWLYVVP